MAPDLTSPATLGREGEGSRINLGFALYWPILNPITVTRGVAYPDLLEPIIAPPGAVMKGIKGCGIVAGGLLQKEKGGWSYQKSMDIGQQMHQMSMHLLPPVEGGAQPSPFTLQGHSCLTGSGLLIQTQMDCSYYLYKSICLPNGGVRMHTTTAPGLGGGCG